MADDEAKILEREEPPRHPGISVLGPSHPLEGRVVRQEGKLTAQKMGAEDGRRVASSGKTLQFFVCFICFFVVLRVRCC